MLACRDQERRGVGNLKECVKRDVDSTGLMQADVVFIYKCSETY